MDEWLPSDFLPHAISICWLDLGILVSSGSKTSTYFFNPSRMAMRLLPLLATTRALSVLGHCSPFLLCFPHDNEYGCLVLRDESLLNE